MDYVIKIKTFEHSDEFHWDKEELTNDFKFSTLKMFTEWAINDPKNLEGIGECPYLILDWIQENLQGAYAFSGIGVGHDTHIYGYFEEPEDAMLFKLTWIDDAGNKKR